MYYIGQTIALVALLASLIAIFWQQKHANKIARIQISEGLTTAYADPVSDFIACENIFLAHLHADENEKPITPRTARICET